MGRWHLGHRFFGRSYLLSMGLVIQETCKDFRWFWLPSSHSSFASFDEENLNQQSSDLVLKYHSDLNAADLLSEINRSKWNVCSNWWPTTLRQHQILNMTHNFDLVGIYPNMAIAYRMFFNNASNICHIRKILQQVLYNKKLPAIVNVSEQNE